MSQRSPFRYLCTNPEFFEFVVMPHLRIPLSLRIVKTFCMSGGIEVSHQTVRV